MSQDPALLISEQSPLLRRTFDLLVDDWSPSSVPATFMMGNLARVFVENITKLSDQEKSDVMRTAEQILKTGNQQNQEAVATGFLEALVSHCSDEGLDLRAIKPMLGPESQRYLDEWDRFMGIRPPAP